MRKRERSAHQPPPPGALTGTARVDRRTKNLLSRLQPGEIAVIDHEDMDRVSAEGFIHRRVLAVVNASKSSSGRYPNLGPLLLCSAGVQVIDNAGAAVMAVPEGSRLILDEGRVFQLVGDQRVEVGAGEVLDLVHVERALDESKRSIADELEKFAENTLSYLKDERDVLLEASRLPEIDTDFHGRHVLIVVRGYDYKDDLLALGAYIREVKPLFVGVDGGADALLEVGLKPDVIIGDMDSVTTEALHCGAELIVHAYPGGTAPGLARVEALGLPSVPFEAAGTSEDIAMLLAFEHGAELIVAVGTHVNLIEFLDKGRKGMASTFLVRLRVGPILVDAKGVSRLYKSTIKRRDLILLVGAALVTMLIVMVASRPMRAEIQILWTQLQNLWLSATRALFG